jgi:stringent starvation protein B
LTAAASHEYADRMSEQSAKPYLVRAICEWCADNGLTPYLAVKVNAETRVPSAFVKNGEIVLNVSASATRRLTIDNDWVRFSARFSGASQEVAVPMSAVAGIFAKETGYGFAFTLSQSPVASLAAATAPVEPDIETALGSDAEDAEVEKKGGKRKPRPSHLQVIK